MKSSAPCGSNTIIVEPPLRTATFSCQMSFDFSGFEPTSMKGRTSSSETSRETDRHVYNCPRETASFGRSGLIVKEEIYLEAIALHRGIASTTQTPATAPAPPRQSPRCSRRWDFGSDDKLAVLRALVRLHDHRVVSDHAPSATHAGPRPQGSGHWPRP